MKGKVWEYEKEARRTVGLKNACDIGKKGRGWRDDFIQKADLPILEHEFAHQGEPSD